MALSPRKLWSWRAGDFSVATAAKRAAGRGKVASTAPGPVGGSHAASAYQDPKVHLPGLLSHCARLGSSELLPNGRTGTLHTDNNCEGLACLQSWLLGIHGYPAGLCSLVRGITLGCVSPSFPKTLMWGSAGLVMPFADCLPLLPHLSNHSHDSCFAQTYYSF